MAEGRLTARQRLVVGATLFSMFFGAGNLILPPLLGVQAGAATLPATIGFFITGVGLPVLGIVAVALAGTVRELADRVHRQMELYHRLPPIKVVPDDYARRGAAPVGGTGIMRTGQFRFRI